MFGISLYFIIAFKGLIAIPEEVELQASFKSGTVLSVKSFCRFVGTV